MSVLSCRHEKVNGISRTVTWARVVVLATMTLLIAPGAWTHSATDVEFFELPAGLACWQRFELGPYRVCGPLSKLLYGLPAHASGLTVDAALLTDDDPRNRWETALGADFQSRNRERYHAIYRCSRILPLLVTLLGALLVCEWSTRLFGPWPGIVSLCAWCWSAPILGHGALVTSDVIAAVVAILAARSYWAFLARPGPTQAALAGLALGMAASTKFTLLILYPCWAALLVVRALWPADRLKERRMKLCVSSIRLFAFGLVAFGFSIVGIDVLYLFHGLGTRLSHFQALSTLGVNLAWLGARPETAWILEIPLPIPLELLRGLDLQLWDVENLGSAYLLGRMRAGGWWYWYPVAALIKAPLSLLALFALAIGRSRAETSDLASVRWAGLCLLVPAAEIMISVATTTGTGTNAAFRYLIPGIGLLCVWAGRAASAGSRGMRIAIVGLLSWLGLNAILGVPDHLGWQNEIGWAWSRWSGRPALIGDSLDWGQDLARLGEWVKRHSAEGATLVCVHGAGRGDPYGLIPPAARPPADGDDGAAFLAVSENILFSYHPRGFGIPIDGRQSFLTREQCGSILGVERFERAGLSVRVYRLSDLGLSFGGASASRSTIARRATDSGGKTETPPAAVPAPSVGTRGRAEPRGAS